MERVWSILVNDDKKVLLLKNKEGEYSTIEGTFLDTDRNYTETVFREVRESTDLRLKSIEGTRGIFQDIYEDKLANYHIYITYVRDGDITLSDKFSSYEWVSFYEFIDKIKFNQDKEYLKNNIKQYLFL